MKTIVQVVQHLSPGGIETMALDLLLHSHANETAYIISLEGTLEEATAHWPVLTPFTDNLIFLNKKEGVSPSLFIKLMNVFKRIKPDSVHTHHIGPLFYAGIASRLMGINTLLHTEHDAWHLENNKRKCLQKFVIGVAKPCIVADAITVANNLKKHLNMRDVKVIHNGINTERFIPGDRYDARAALSLPTNASIIGCGGRLEPVKGQHFLIEALSLLPDTAHLAIAGDGSERDNLRHLAHQLGIAHRVHFLGRIDIMETFYQSLDVFCLPSLNEGFPLSPLEAQSCGIRTLVTHVGGAHETICPKTGMLVEKENPEALALSLQHMLKQPKSLAPRTYVEQHGNVQLMASAYRDLRNGTQTEEFTL